MREFRGRRIRNFTKTGSPAKLLIKIMQVEHVSKKDFSSSTIISSLGLREKVKVKETSLD